MTYNRSTKSFDLIDLGFGDEDGGVELLSDPRNALDQVLLDARCEPLERLV